MSSKLVACVIATAITVPTSFAIADDKSDIVEASTDIEEDSVESHVFFEFDKAELSPQAKAELDKAAAWLNDTDHSIIVIEGHADLPGTKPYNLNLSDRRAEMTKQYLVDKGVDESRIVVIAFGESLPVVDTTDPAPRNRRIVLHAVQSDTTVPTQAQVQPVEQPQPAAPPAAQPAVPVGYAEWTEADVTEPMPEEDDDMFDISLALGVGAIGNIGQSINNFTDPGVAWNARVSFNTDYVVGVEAAYVGSAQDLDDGHGFSDSSLIGNGVEGNLRLNVPLEVVRPYVFGGVGWTHYQVTDRDLDEGVIHVPGGAGVDVTIDDSFLIDLRGTIRGAFEDDLLENTRASGDADLDSWSVAAGAGYNF